MQVHTHMQAVYAQSSLRAHVTVYACMQAAAQQCLGLVPVKFPSVFHKVAKHYPLVQRALQRDYYWSPDFYNNTWFIDAFTVDPSQMLTGETGIWERGRPQPVNERKMVNANVGTLPKITPYIGVHKEHGCKLWFPWHGAKHGGAAATKEEEGAMYHCCKFWFEGLSDFLKKHLHEYTYYNKDQAYKKAPAEIRKRLEKPYDAAASIDPRNFLVCHSAQLMPTYTHSTCCPQPRASPARMRLHKLAPHGTLLSQLSLRPACSP